ncbi:hypothetical protein FRX31_016373 [Thalictrum thalictroides]|uniref:Transposase Tnp1/En/Spm-like domain-containing protein n=1 Tax=Thalictrum thalictroides TaxID=46969 RepID=A0A7J6WBR3_THATH|nr:hypothetical protein FRX31_016373 [Thalictrum thalictroides]
MSSNPESQNTCNDAVTEVLGPDSRGRFRAGGAGVCKTQMKKMANIKKKQAYEGRKNEEWKTSIQGQLAEVTDAVKDLTSIVRDMRSVPQTGSHRGERALSSDVGKMVKVLGGWPTIECAWGIVKNVDPTHKYCERCLGDGNYLVYVTNVLVSEAVLPLPHDDHYTTLGELGQGHVIWPKASLVFV